MQLRHLRYFVKIVEAGSFSRAAATIHVAQPALSQQIAELEEQLGLSLLLRSARGVRPTAAGEALYREASTILRLMERLPGIVRSGSGAIEGTVSVGMSSTLAASLAGAFIEACKSALPQVTLKLAVANSELVKARIQAQTLDMAIVFEDEQVPNFARKPLFRQQLYLVGRKKFSPRSAAVSLKYAATLPLILPSLPNVTRSLLDRAFAAAAASPNVVAEADMLSSILSMVQTGIGCTIIPKGDLSDLAANDLKAALVVDPPLFLTASAISSGDYPLTYAGESVQNVLTSFVERHLRETKAPGAEWIG